MRQGIDLTGEVFGFYTVLRESGRTSKGEILWLCKCRCGREKVVRGSHLRRGEIVSCGCFSKEQARELGKELARKYLTKHGLSVTFPRLYQSVNKHFRLILGRVGSYGRYEIPYEYSHDCDGAVKFCKELIRLYPEECKRYETDKTLHLDKDFNSNGVFAPEFIRFIPASDNLSHQWNNALLSDGTRLVDFCSLLNIPVKVAGRINTEYKKYFRWCKQHSGELHPELAEKANTCVSVMRKCVQLLSLLRDARELKARICSS